MRVVIFGATGMVGQGALRECLRADDVESVLVVGRTGVGHAHPKLREVRHDDFADLTPIDDVLAGYDACFYCLGVSSAGRGEADYTRVTYDFTMAAARTLARFIQPVHGARSKTGLYRVGYAVSGPLLPLLRRIWPRSITTTESLGSAMLRVAREGAPKRVLESADLR